MFSLSRAQADEASQLNNALCFQTKWRGVLIQHALLRQQGAGGVGMAVRAGPWLVRKGRQSELRAAVAMRHLNS